MLPPSDSINHQSLKLAEFFASLRSSQSQNRLSVPPPPPYAPPTTSSSFPTMPVAIEDSFADIEDDDDEATSLAPIMIKVDTSIEIEGQGNTIVIPTSNGGMGMAGDEATSAPTSTSSSPAPSSSSPLQQLQQLQQQRQVKSAQLASTIIAALKSSGVLEDKESRRQRPIEVNVNAGIRIRGDRNVVCAGAGVRRRMELSDERDSGAVSGSGHGRKRRAGSQPIDIPSAKKPLV
ncbi:hypothetical protein FQN50_009070 [Emmonsiellopsis sp. PD_5]|nr:hypothetical protein FQN50_009070 [Emmonsiellopsis sp. PD_5]